MRRVASRSELAFRRKHGTIGQLWHSGSEFNPRQHNRPREHCHPAGRHDSDPRLDITEWDVSEYNYPWVYFP